MIYYQSISMVRNKWALLLIMWMMACVMGWAQAEKTRTKNSWKTISKDEMVTISYNTNIITKKNGEHIVWVKAVYHMADRRQWHWGG